MRSRRNWCGQPIVRSTTHRKTPRPLPLARLDGETLAQWPKRLARAKKAELAAWRNARRWHPHQLRHNAATELRKEFGIETARIILGHHGAAITEVYAEKDERQAIAAMLNVG
jgi:integrase